MISESSHIASKTPNLISLLFFYEAEHVVTDLLPDTHSSAGQLEATTSPHLHLFGLNDTPSRNGALEMRPEKLHHSPLSSAPKDEVQTILSLTRASQKVDLVVICFDTVQFWSG